MFTVTYQSDNNKQHNSGFLFTTYNAAREYLEKNDFVYANGVFLKKKSKWNNITKAYIESKKIYK